MITALYHLAAGAVAGGVFPVQFLLLLIAGTLLECGVAVSMYGFVFMGTALELLFAVQVGYLAGIYFRSRIEAGLINAFRRGYLRRN